MRKLLSTIAAAGALTLAAAAATPAAAIDFVGDFDVTNYNTDAGLFGGLVINVTPKSGPIGFELNNAGDTTGFNHLFTISSPEQSMDFDDLLFWKPIEVTFDFSSPDFGGTIGGSTGGTADWNWSIFGFDNEGNVVWDGPQSFAFGDTGLLTVELKKADFDLGSSASVQAKFTLESLPSAVPEPGTWALMITGFGLAGAALRRQRKLAMTAA
jgi:hypothetical protein